MRVGASTVEAQANVAAQVANEVLAVLEGRPTQFAVNAPSLRLEDVEALEPYRHLVVMLGKLATQLADDHLRSAEIIYRGEIADRNVGILTAAAVQGLLEPISATPVNLVNSRLLAQQRSSSSAFRCCLSSSGRRSWRPLSFTVSANFLLLAAFHLPQGEWSLLMLRTGPI